VTEGGGFAGLVRTTVVDAADLTPADAATLRAMVADADLFDLPPSTGSAYPDVISYEITVSDADRHHTVVLTDPDLPPETRALLTWLRTVPGAHTTLV